MQLSQKDEGILEHLTNITCEELEGEEDEDGDEIAGFRLSFHFAKNPFFDHKVLVSPSRATPEGIPPFLTKSGEGTARLHTSARVHCVRLQHDALLVTAVCAAQTKTYHIFEEDGEPILHKAEGTEIEWKSGKNPTVKVNVTQASH